MDLKAAILKEHSAAQKNKIAKYIGSNPDRFDELMQLFLKGEYRVTQRASWIVSECAESHPELIKPYLKKILTNLTRPSLLHNAVKRNTLRILQFMDIPEALKGTTADLCLELLNDKKEAIAVKAFAMTVVFNISQKYPDLRNELRIIIEDQLPYSSPGFKSRGNKILKQLITNS